MSSIDPENAVSPRWMHPDLRRQIDERLKHTTQGRMRDMSHNIAQLRRRVSALDTLLAQEQLQQRFLTAALHELQQDMHTTEQLRQQAETMSSELQRQALFQRSHALPSLILTHGERAADTILGCDEFTRTENTPPNTVLTTNRSISVTPSVTSLPHAIANRALQPLILSGLSPYMAPLYTTTHTRFTSSSSSAREFCAQYAPLFTWNEAQGCVERPRFMAEPCAIEQVEPTEGKEEEGVNDAVQSPVSPEDAVNASHTNSLKVVVQCRSAACLYWHHDQLRHVQYALRPLLHVMEALCTHNSDLCCVSEFCTQFRALVMSSTSLQVLCGRVAWALHVLITRGWHEVILRDSDIASSSSSTKGPRVDRIYGWPIPVLSHTVSPHTPITNTSNSAVGVVRIDHLRYAAEGKAWLSLLRPTSSATEGNPTSGQLDTIAEGDTTESNTSSLAQRATMHFLRAPNAMTWRCLMRATCTTSNSNGATRRLWLAERGVMLFPCVGALQISRVLALLECCFTNNTISSAVTVTPQECVQACLSAAHSLAAQAAAATIVAECQEHEAHTATNAKQKANGAEATALSTETYYAALTSRQIAFLIARCAVLLAARGSTSNECAIAAEELLETVVCGVGPALGLMPVALTNLTLMFIVLKQTGTLPSPALLPLGAISDQLFTVTQLATRRPQEMCGRLLYRQLELISTCEKDKVYYSDGDEVLAQMRSAVQLSLLRLYALELQYVEQIIRKSALLSEHTQGVLWSEYVRHVAQYDSAQAASFVARQLTQPACKVEEEDTDAEENVNERRTWQPSCVLYLLTSWWLDIYGTTTNSEDSGVEQSIHAVCTAFLTQYHIESSDLAIIYADPARLCAQRASKSVPRMELAAFFILLSAMPTLRGSAGVKNNHNEEESNKAGEESEEEVNEARLRWLLALPCETFVTDIDAFTLLLVTQLRLSAALRSLPFFTIVLERGLIALREIHLLYWSPLDTYYNDALGTAHAMSLFVYRHVPMLLGNANADVVMAWRRAVLAVSERVGVLHPLLREDTIESV